MPDSTRRKRHSNSTPSDGDTQPVSQWVYDAKEQASVKNGVACIQEEGGTGHIDLLANFEQDVDPRTDTEVVDGQDDEDDVDLVSQDIRAEPFPEALRFQLPETPHVQGTKRRRSDQGDPLQTETPTLPRNPFANLNDADVMGPSQIFQATQAQTSPNIPNPDVLYERPSPHINNLGRPLTAEPLSSPAFATDRQSSLVRIGPEPQSTYVSMKESQEARERRLQQMRAEQDDGSDDEFGLPSRIQPPQNSRQIWGRRKAGIQVASKSPQQRLPRNANSEHNGRLQDRQAVRRLGRRASEVVVISDDAVAGGSQGNVTEDETEREEEKEKDYDGEVDELAEENKENVEVPMTVSRSNLLQMFTSHTTPSRNHIRRRTGTQGANSATQVRGSPGAESSPTRRAGPENGTQSYAIRDSQSSQQPGSKGRPAHSVASVPQSSPDSRRVILQSQPSQTPKTPSLSSSVLQKPSTSAAVIQLPSSSPLGLNNLEVEQSKTNNVRTAAENEEEPLIDRSGGSVTCSSVQLHTAQFPSAKEVHHVISTVSGLPERGNRTASENGSTIIAPAVNRQTIPNSSQDPSSSGSMALAVANAASSKLSNEQSLTTTLYETAREQLRVSPSKVSAQRLQVRSQGSRIPSPATDIQPRTLGEIAADPSPPDPVEDVNLSDFGLLSKDDEDYQQILRGPSLKEPAKRKRHVKNATLWKGHSSPPPGYGTPVGPAFSQKSNPVDVQSTGSQSSSPLSTPPASQDIRLPTPAVFKNIREMLAPDAAPPNDMSVPTPVQTLLDPVPSRLSSAAQTSTSLRTRPAAVGRLSPPAGQTRASQTPGPHANLTTITDARIIAPDRVFAHFNGNPSGYYTATCLGVLSEEEPRYTVRYDDDGVEDSISAAGIKRLELRPGDVVKLHLCTLRTGKYVVVGMQDKQDLSDPDTLARRRKANPDDEGAWPKVDIHGYAKVLLAPKQWDSHGGNQRSDEQLAVELCDISFTQGLWTNIKDRGYTHNEGKSRALEGLQTPSERPSTPSSPTTRAKRGKVTSLASSIPMNEPKQGLFANMVFTLTNICHTTDLERTKSLILSYGGKILEEGFDSLFYVPSLHRITSPRKSDSDREFHLTRPAQNLGFTCLIADKYCRRAKYIQALALGIPCLATRWISDCVSKQRILPWSAYLLPAGESAFLGGAARSRVLPSLLAETATLSSTINQRPRMLEGASILLIMSKAEEESMRQHPLITFALSPARVARALTIEAAARAVAEAQAVGEPWDWVFSYDREREVERMLFGSAAKKRKSRSGVGAGQDRKTKVIGNEFVIQSLILGQLVDV